MTVKTILKWLDMLTAWGFVVGLACRLSMIIWFNGFPELRQTILVGVSNKRMSGCISNIYLPVP